LCFRPGAAVWLGWYNAQDRPVSIGESTDIGSDLFIQFGS
jgi:hypothetical protein